MDKSDGLTSAETEQKPTRESSPDPLIGSVIDGRFQVREEIGRGATAVVYLAHQQDMDRLVAIKVLPPLTIDMLEYDRFRREISLLADLNHPSIVQVFSSGVTEGGRPYLVMEYLEGKTLSALLLERENLPTHWVESIALQCADALAFAHSKGIIHRDLKPANIFVSMSNDAPIIKVIDFGLSKLLNETASQKVTNTGAITGTPAFMSPEQCRGETLDHRTDLYSLGCVMYTMISGKPPFTADNLYALLSKHDADTPPPLRSSSSVPPYLEAAVFRLLKKRKEDRFNSAEALTKCLKLKTSSPFHFGRPLSRQGKLSLLIGSAALAIVTLLAGTILWLRTQETLALESEFERLLSDPDVSLSELIKVEEALVGRLNHEGKGSDARAREVSAKVVDLIVDQKRRSAQNHGNTQVLKTKRTCSSDNAKAYRIAAEQADRLGIPSREYWVQCAENYSFYGKQFADVELPERAMQQYQLSDEIFTNKVFSPNLMPERFYLNGIDIIRTAEILGKRELAQKVFKHLESGIEADRKLQHNDMRESEFLIAQGYLLELDGDHKAALDCFKRAYEKGFSQPGSRHVAALLQVADGCDKAGDYQQANAYYQKSVSDASTVESKADWSAVPAAKYHYAEFLRKYKRTEEAVPLYKDAAKAAMSYFKRQPFLSSEYGIKCARGLRLCGKFDDGKALIDSTIATINKDLAPRAPNAESLQLTMDFAKKEHSSYVTPKEGSR